MTIVWLCSGILLGATYAWTQWQTVQRLDPQSAQRGFLLLFIGVIARWLIAAALLIAAARTGLMPLLATASGFLITRWLFVLWTNRT